MNLSFNTVIVIPSLNGHVNVHFFTKTYGQNGENVI